MANTANVAKAQEIIEICNNKQYMSMLNGKPKLVKLSDIEAAEYISSEDLDQIKFDVKGSCGDIRITPNSAVSDLFTIRRTQPDAKIGILNFASSYHPGGGFITGAMAQEEALCHASTLYAQLNSCEKLYNENKKSNSDTYTDNMAVCKTQFIRTDSGVLVPNPAEAIVITSAAVNNNKVRDKNSDRIKLVMKQRMHKIIMLAIREKIKVLILGAFGCGVFRNDPYFIADTWKFELSQYGAYFDCVYFSILTGKNGTNLSAFEAVFGK